MRRGSLSFFALNGANVVCSDLTEIPLSTKKMHVNHGVSKNITYAMIDATCIPEKYSGCFDYVIFKSVLGGVGSNNNIEKQLQMVKCIKQVLKPNGLCIFAENMRASSLHKWARERFLKRGKTWHYEKKEEIEELFSDFCMISEKYYGFLGCFGRNEIQRDLLGSIDTVLFDRVIANKNRCIGSYIFQRQ